MEELKYPVGRFEAPARIGSGDVSNAIDVIAALPLEVRSAVEGLSSEQLDTPYRPDGWTVRQVVHHLADSHLNSYVRYKLALTEEAPTIKPYDEAAWAELVDGKTADPEVSLKLLEAVHERWVMLLRSMSPEDFQRALNHPERGIVLLDWMTLLYAWHSRHHVAHINNLVEREGWDSSSS